jgi:hypothetical protein
MEVDEEIKALDKKLQELYRKKNRLTGRRPLILPKERPFFLKEDYTTECNVVTVVQEEKDGVVVGDTDPYTQRMKDRKITFHLREEDEIDAFTWSRVHFTWDDHRAVYYCDSYMCKEPHHFDIGERAKEDEDEWKKMEEEAC